MQGVHRGISEGSLGSKGAQQQIFVSLPHCCLIWSLNGSVIIVLYFRIRFYFVLFSVSSLSGFSCFGLVYKMFTFSF